MQVNYERALTTLQSRRLARGEAEQRLSELTEAAHARPAAAGDAEADLSLARLRLAQATAAHEAARRSLRHAGRERDATPRGLAQLALVLSDARDEGDGDLSVLARARVDQAVARMDAEARERQARRRPGQRQPKPFVHEVLPRGVQAASPLDDLLKRDRVSAIAKHYYGRGLAERQVRVFRFAEGEPKPRMIEFTLTDASPTTASVIADRAHLAGDASLGASSPARAKRAAKAREHLVRLFGEEGADEYVQAADPGGPRGSSVGVAREEFA